MFSNPVGNKTQSLAFQIKLNFGSVGNQVKRTGFNWRSSALLKKARRFLLICSASSGLQ